MSQYLWILRSIEIVHVSIYNHFITIIKILPKLTLSIHVLAWIGHVWCHYILSKYGLHWFVLVNPRSDRFPWVIIDPSSSELLWLRSPQIIFCSNQIYLLFPRNISVIRKKKNNFVDYCIQNENFHGEALSRNYTHSRKFQEKIYLWMINGLN